MKIQVIQEMLSNNPELEITYFIPDDKKEGGRYETIVDNIVEKCQKHIEYGARPIIRIIQDDVEDVITNEILANDFEVGSTFMLTIENEKVKMLKYEEAVAK